ncbi:Hypothetical predicted protein [Olea europaea subsp. europaea]|uniref:Uncharacterized protein n=1 Tax=Olea europaea subsp. europaea TaxID=158383 RepID=A0A8S0SFB1_OLEEU|nr:Hypothetical predicted protein [Olea europaea subsp. europaea]
MACTGDPPPPPFETNNEEKQNESHQPRSTLSKPQSFPSSHDDEDDYASQIKPQSISTPPNGDDFGSPIKPQAFPPSNEEAAATPMASWNGDLCDCLKDSLNALFTAFFSYLTFGQIIEIVHSGHTYKYCSCGSGGMMYSVISFCIGIPCIMSCTYRTKLRSKFKIIESPAPDWVLHCFCEWCALCQEYGELKQTGYDPSIGILSSLPLCFEVSNSMFGIA